MIVAFSFWSGVCQDDIAELMNNTSWTLDAVHAVLFKTFSSAPESTAILLRSALGIYCGLGLFVGVL